MLAVFVSRSALDDLGMITVNRIVANRKTIERAVYKLEKSYLKEKCSQTTNHSRFLILRLEIIRNYIICRERINQCIYFTINLKKAQHFNYKRDFIWSHLMFKTITERCFCLFLKKWRWTVSLILFDQLL